MTRAKAQPVAAHVAGGPPQRSDAHRSAAGTWRTLGGLGMWTALAVALVWGLERLSAYARAVTPVPPCRLEWVDLPTWLTTRENEPILHHITEAVGLQAADDLRDPLLAGRLGASLSNSPWVSQVKRISKQSTGTIRVHAEFREPFAFVESSGYAFLIDAAGVRLPVAYVVSYVDERYWHDWLRIVGVAAPLPNEGEVWGGDDLAAGRRLIQYLKQAGARGEVPFRPALRAVDVANFRRRENDYDAELRLRTVHGRSYIAWGLPPGEEFEVEAPASRKLEMLRSFYTEHGGQFPDGWVYDVRGADGIRRWPYRDKVR